MLKLILSCYLYVAMPPIPASAYLPYDKEGFFIPPREATDEEISDLYKYLGVLEGLVEKHDNRSMTVRPLFLYRIRGTSEHKDYTGKESLQTVYFCKSLFEGKGPKYFQPASMPFHACETYTPKDVKVGDIVEMRIHLINFRRFECDMFTIMRRPGGKVPVAPEDERKPPIYGFCHHQTMQFEQDFEEKETPFPVKYNPPNRYEFLKLRQLKIQAILATAKTQQLEANLVPK